jgi:hypothetical protein
MQTFLRLKKWELGDEDSNKGGTDEAADLL